MSASGSNFTSQNKSSFFKGNRLIREGGGVHLLIEGIGSVFQEQTSDLGCVCEVMEFAE